MKKPGNNAKFGEILRDKNEITQEQLNEALKIQCSCNKKIGEILVDKGYINEITVIKTLSEQLGINIINLDKYQVDANATRLISEKLAKRTVSIPVKISNDKIIVAIADPVNILYIEDIEIESGKRVEIVLASKEQILSSIEKYMGNRGAEKAVEDFKKENRVEESNDNYVETDFNVSNSPVVRLINSLVRQALKLGASDIHIEPFENKIRVRFRIDGDLQEILTPSKHTQSAIITRVKIIAGMNIAENRLPQDGRIEMKVDDTTVDLRISAIPTVYGEKIVIRLLDRKNFLKTKEELGFLTSNMKLFDSILESPNGIILVTGPTGSGKTTTLYAALNELNKISKNIITIEDPVEYKIEGINQVQVNTKAGLMFSNGLRSILRQDPDIIMVGEIRDEETAEIAIRAAITGHLVISTLHTNDAPTAIIRLKDMGIKLFLLEASLRGIISQRLVKKICTNCKKEYTASEYEKELLGVPENIKLYKGEGCPKCYNTGYSGRTAIHEILHIDKSVRDEINKGGNIENIRSSAELNGMKTLQENCKQLVLKGVTSIEQYLQITQ